MASNDPPPESFRLTAARACARVFSLLVLITGLVVIVGWAIGSIRLTQIDPHWSSMKFNNAVCLAAEGIALLLLSGAWARKLRIGIGAFVAGLATLTLLQDAFGFSAGIDELIFKDTNPVKTAFPGRMSILSSICHLMMGLVILADLRPRNPALRIARTFLPPLLLSISGSAVLGYLFGIEQAYGWGDLTRMALHTALSFLLLAFALICLGPDPAAGAARERWRLAPYLAGGWFLISIVTITVFFNARKSLTDLVDQEGKWIRASAEREWTVLEAALERLAAREAARQARGQGPDTADIRQYGIDFPAIAWIESQGFLHRHRDPRRYDGSDAGFRSGPIAVGIDLHGLFGSFSGQDGSEAKVEFSGTAFPEAAAGKVAVDFALAGKSARVDLSGATLLRKAMNQRANYVIGIAAILLAVFTGLALAMGAKAERRSRELAESNALLERSSKELARSNSDLEQFVFVASHDLQTPIRHIGGFARLLMELPEMRAHPQASEYGGLILAGVDRMQKLISGVLEVSRVEKSAHAPQAIDAGEMMARAARNLEPDLALAGGEIAIEPGLPVVRGNALRLSQLFDNLILNAIKYRHKERKLRIRIRYRGEPGRRALLIEDNGMGIPPDQREKVFQMFHRLHGQSEIKGTGIGLTLCRRIAEQHGFRITLEDSDLGGVAVRIAIPESALAPASSGAGREAAVAAA